MHGEPFECPRLFLNWRPNRSLSAHGRRLWFGLIASATLLMAAGAATLGAWMVLPFAGAELLLVWLAFQVIESHDDDYESLRISDQEFCWEQSERGRVYTLRGNRAWMQVVGETAGGNLAFEGRGDHIQSHHTLRKLNPTANIAVAFVLCPLPANKGRQRGHF